MCQLPGGRTLGESNVLEGKMSAPRAEAGREQFGEG